MDTLFHFIFSIIVGLSINTRITHKLRTLIAIAFLSILVDIDHFMGAGSRGTFHNIFFVLFLPFLMLLIFYVYENKKSIKLQTYSLLLLVMLTGHVVGDMMVGGTVKLLYPFSNTMYAFPQHTILATSEFYSPVVSGDGLMLLVYSAILLSATFIEDFIYFFEKKHEQVKTALMNAKTDLV